MKTASLAKMIAYGVIAATVGSVLGVFLAWKFAAKSNEVKLQNNREQTRWILSKMGTIHVGDTLPDMAFESTEGRIYLLSELARGTHGLTLCYIRPDCPACISQLTRMSKLIKRGSTSPFAVVSSGNPLHLKEIQKRLLPEIPFLWDENGAFSEALNLSVTPFNLVLDSSLRITAVAAYPLTEQEMTTIVKEMY